MSFVAIMQADNDGRVAKYMDFSTEEDATAHVERFKAEYPAAFVVPRPAEPFAHWKVNMPARRIGVAVPPSPPTPTRAERFEALVARSGLTPKEFIDELKERQASS